MRAQSLELAYTNIVVMGLLKNIALGYVAALFGSAAR